MITTLIFDIGNVLVAFDWQANLKACGFSEEKREAIANAVYRSEDWNEMDRGVLTLEEVTQRFVRRLPQYEEDIRRLITDTRATISRYPYTKPLLRALRAAGFKTYYLSNYGEFGYEQTKDQLDFISLMDGGLFSYEVKMIKPNPWIFAELLARYDINPAEAVFFDDNPLNVKAAQKMGLQAEVFTEVGQVEKFLNGSRNM